MVSKLKNLFQLFYEYRSNSKFQKLAKITKIKDVKILWNVKSRWTIAYRVRWEIAQIPNC
jgi:hypothetical protein